MQTSYARRVLILIAVVSVLKLITASLIELGNDEVYYWTYALQPDWNHFDHPPMVGWMIRLTTLNLHWVSELSLRLGSILCAGLSTWFIFLTGKLLKNDKAGWYAALIYNCSVYTCVIAGLFILPDSPQMPFWTAALYIMAHLFLRSDEEQKIGNWLLLGFMIGLAALCKVHALYLWGGFGLFMLLARPKWLLNWRLYTGVAVTALCLLPVLYWNVQYDFITYKFHSARVTHSSLQWDSFLQEVVGEILYQNPVVYVLLLVALIGLLRKKIRLYRKSIRVWLLCMSIPMILLFWFIALRNATLPHWSGPGYIPLFLAGGLFLEERSKKIFPAVLGFAGGLLFVVLVAGVALIRFSPVNFGSHDAANYGEYCPTLDLSGWKDFSNRFKTIREKDMASGRMKAGAPILVNKWFPGGHLEFYTSRATGTTLLGVGPLEEIHKFAWLNKERKPLQQGDDAYALVPSNIPLNVQEAYGKYFTSIQSADSVKQMRSGGVVRYFYVYRLKNCKRVPEAVLK
jgi:hypothetical protein